METCQVENPTVKLRELANLVNHQTEEILELESRLKVLKNMRQDITHKEMPELMNEMGVDMIMVKGKKFTKDLYVSGVWPKDKDQQEIALLHLKELGATDLIKTELIAKFDRSEYDLAQYCLEKIAPLCTGEATIKVGVHPMTLRSFVKKRLQENDDVDPESLGLYTSSYVKVK